MQSTGEIDKGYLLIPQGRAEELGHYPVGGDQFLVGHVLIRCVCHAGITGPVLQGGDTTHLGKQSKSE